MLVEVLRRYHDLGGFDRFAVLVAHGDLALGVRAERFGFSGSTRLGKQLQDAVRVIDRRRHQFRRFDARIAEHDALVARALVLVAGRIDALRDIGRLRVQVHGDVRPLPMESGLLVADVLDRQARDVGHVIAGDRRGPARLPGDHDAVGGGERLAGDADLARLPAVPRRELEERVHHLVGNPVADLVRMAFGYRLAGEQIARA